MAVDRPVVQKANRLTASDIGTPPHFACRAWVSFNGVNMVLNGSGNVASLTDYGVGSYGINFAKPMPDTQYNTVASAGRNVADTAALSAWERSSNKTVNNTEVNVTFCATGNQGLSDYESINVAIFR